MQMITNKIVAIFVCKRFQDSGKDQAPDYYIYEFADITDDKVNKYGNKWIKETALMKAVPFKSGNRYQIIFSPYPFLADSVRLPYPVDISWAGGRVHIKNGNSIKVEIL